MCVAQPIMHASASAKEQGNTTLAQQINRHPYIKGQANLSSQTETSSYSLLDSVLTRAKEQGNTTLAQPKDFLTS